MNYDEFLSIRAQLANAGGFEPTELPAHLFDALFDAEPA